MKNISKTTVIVAIGTLAIGLWLGWFFFGRSKEEITKVPRATRSESKTTWTCSMHPQIRRKKPGQCPICGMNLIALDHEASDVNPMTVSMSATAMELAHVQTMVVGYERAKKIISLNGKIKADERALFTQSSHIPGRVEKLMVNFTGDFVTEGQVIANVYSPDLVTAQEELLEAKKISDTRPALFLAAKEKLKNWKLTDQQIQQIVATNKTIEQFPILANTSGYVTKKMVNLGDYLKQGAAIYIIADLSKVWILFDVYESEIPWVKKEDNITYTIASFPDKTFRGTIRYIDPVIDPVTRVAKARVETNNPRLILKPEMFASGTVETRLKKKVISVPKTAVMWTGKRAVIYVMQKSTQDINFLMRQVVLGPALGQRYVIASGLQAGETIAVNGTFSIDAAAQLAGKPSMMNPEDTIVTKRSIILNNTNFFSLLFNSYFQLKKALVNDDFQKAKKAGKLLDDAVRTININSFKEGDRKFLTQQLSLLKANTRHIRNPEGIKKIRDRFIKISYPMIAIATSFSPISQLPLYVHHCPMADANNGADWLSKEKKILNPYFGQSMISCGENIKIIQ